MKGSRNNDERIPKESRNNDAFQSPAFQSPLNSVLIIGKKESCYSSLNSTVAGAVLPQRQVIRDNEGGVKLHVLMMKTPSVTKLLPKLLSIYFEAFTGLQNKNGRRLPAF